MRVKIKRIQKIADVVPNYKNGKYIDILTKEEHDWNDFEMVREVVVAGILNTTAEEFNIEVKPQLSGFIRTI